MAREAGRHVGGSAALLELIEEHRPALTFDFRRYFGLSLREVGGSVTYGEALHLVFELRNESGSHLHMGRHGLSETASLADIATITHAEWYMNGHKKDGAPTIELPRPWSVPDPNADVTPARRAELKAQLQRRSAFAA